MQYHLVIRDSDGAILTSHRGAGIRNADATQVVGPFGDIPFATATTLKPGYSAIAIDVLPGQRPPRGPSQVWIGSAVVPASPAFQDAWMDGADPRRPTIRALQADPAALVRHTTAWHGYDPPSLGWGSWLDPFPNQTDL